jgi:hypothetical protein
MNATQTHPEALQAAKRICQVCQDEFVPRRPWQRFCGAACRRVFHQPKVTIDALAKRVDELERRLDAMTKALP